MYTLGNLEIKNEGNKPDKNNVRAFLDYAIGKVEDIELDAIVWGKTLTNWKEAKDFDFTLTGKIINYNKLENLFFDLNNYAFNVINLKLDLQWISNTNIVKINENNKIVFNDVEYIVFGYWSKNNIIFRYFAHNITVNDNFYTPVSQWLVKSNFNKLTSKPWLNKPHQEKQIKENGKFLSVSAKDFLIAIDDYFKE